MCIEIESLSISALGFSAPWRVEKINLDTARRRIDFNLTCDAKRLVCPACSLADQGIHDRQKRGWRHLDFFKYEAWLHADVPRIAFSGCGKTTQVAVPWARDGSGFTALFESLALSFCRELPVRQAAALLRCTDKQLWRRIDRYVDAARKFDDMSAVRVVGIDDTSLRKRQNYITVVHNLEKKRMLFACEGKDHQTVVNFAQDLQAHGGNQKQIAHVCKDMSAAFSKGLAQALAQAQISYDRFHVVAMGNGAMNEVRREKTRTQPQSIKTTLGNNDRKLLKSLAWDMRRNPDGWSKIQINALHWLRHSTLKSARAWHLKMALRTVYINAAKHNGEAMAKAALSSWLSWATRCRLEPFKKLAVTLKQRIDAGSARHVGQPQQRLCGGHKWTASAGKTSCAWLQNHEELYRHRVFTNVKA